MPGIKRLHLIGRLFQNPVPGNGVVEHQTPGAPRRACCDAHFEEILREQRVLDDLAPQLALFDIGDGSWDLGILEMRPLLLLAQPAAEGPNPRGYPERESQAAL